MKNKVLLFLFVAFCLSAYGCGSKQVDNHEPHDNTAITGDPMEDELDIAKQYLSETVEDDIFNFFSNAALIISNGQFGFNSPAELSSNDLFRYAILVRDTLGEEIDWNYNDESSSLEIPVKDIHKILDTYFSGYSFKPQQITKYGKYDEKTDLFITDSLNTQHISSVDYASHLFSALTFSSALGSPSEEPYLKLISAAQTDDRNICVEFEDPLGNNIIINALITESGARFTSCEQASYSTRIEPEVSGIETYIKQYAEETISKLTQKTNELYQRDNVDIRIIDGKYIEYSSITEHSDIAQNGTVLICNIKVALQFTYAEERGLYIGVGERSGQNGWVYQNDYNLVMFQSEDSDDYELIGVLRNEDFYAFPYKTNLIIYECLLKENIPSVPELQNEYEPLLNQVTKNDTKEGRYYIETDDLEVAAKYLSSCLLDNNSKLVELSTFRETEASIPGGEVWLCSMSVAFEAEPGYVANWAFESLYDYNWYDVSLMSAIIYKPDAEDATYYLLGSIYFDDPERNNMEEYITSLL